MKGDFRREFYYRIAGESLREDGEPPSPGAFYKALGRNWGVERGSELVSSVGACMNCLGALGLEPTLTCTPPGRSPHLGKERPQTQPSLLASGKDRATHRTKDIFSF